MENLIDERGWVIQLWFLPWNIIPRNFGRLGCNVPAFGHQSVLRDKGTRNLEHFSGPHHGEEAGVVENEGLEGRGDQGPGPQDGGHWFGFGV